jgi:hypothetical protein
MWDRIRFTTRAVKSSRVAVVITLIILAERPAAAYTDPGSGALLWQVLVAGFVGAAFYLRKWTRRFRNKRNGKDNGE